MSIHSPGLVVDGRRHSSVTPLTSRSRFRSIQASISTGHTVTSSEPRPSSRKPVRVCVCVCHDFFFFFWLPIRRDTAYLPVC
ncbi:hypothetical protein BKA81DRAFT_347483, partial [Phyllosticta paracitricarpa]